MQIAHAVMLECLPRECLSWCDIADNRLHLAVWWSTIVASETALFQSDFLQLSEWSEGMTEWVGTSACSVIDITTLCFIERCHFVKLTITLMFLGRFYNIWTTGNRNEYSTNKKQNIPLHINYVSKLHYVVHWQSGDVISKLFISYKMVITNTAMLLSRYRSQGDWCCGWVSWWWSCYENDVHWSTTDAVSWHADDAYAAWNARDATKLPWNDHAICKFQTFLSPLLSLLLWSRDCRALQHHGMQVVVKIL